MANSKNTRPGQKRTQAKAAAHTVRAAYAKVLFKEI